MKIIKFDLDRMVRLIPLSGKTSVSINTTGEVTVAEQVRNSTPRKKPVVIASTRHAVLMASPLGHSRTLKVILPEGRATMGGFFKEIVELFKLVFGK